MKVTIEIDSQKSVILNELPGKVNIILNNLGVTMPLSMTDDQFNHFIEQLNN